MHNQQALGRLYLSKNGKKDIYVDYHSLLPQHHIDGIRFLYRQFKKKKPGVILNDPAGYGKGLQIVLFLNAIHSILTKPIFILCNDDDIQKWENIFINYTGIQDIAVASTNPYTKGTVHINTMQQAKAFARRDWAVVIVHDNTFHDMLKVTLKAEFKIWCTSVDMKTNLRSFASIYEWIHPCGKVNIDDFQVKTNRPNDVFEKSILLDAFLEDIVLRRNDIEDPKVCEIMNTQPELKKVSKKNKDPTGTKVKRSKRRRIEDDDNEIGRRLEDHPKSTAIVARENDDQTKVDQVQNGNPIPSEGSIDNRISNSTRNSNDSVDLMKQFTEPPTTFKHVVLELVDSENSEGNEHIQKAQIVENINEEKNNEFTCSNNKNFINDFTEESKLLESNEDNKKISQKDNNYISSELSVNDNKSVSNHTNITHQNIIDNNKTDKDFNIGLDNNMLQNDNSCNVEKDKHEVNNIGDPMTDSVVKPLCKSDSSGDCDDKSKGSSKVSKDIDEVLADLEKKTMMKFKGSILDTLF